MAIELISKIKQKNSGQFFLVDAIDVDVKLGNSESKYPETSLTNYLQQIPSDTVVHGESKELLSNILETYILTIDYDKTLAFDVNKIVVGTGSGGNSGDSSDISETTAVLGKAVLGKMILG